MSNVSRVDRIDRLFAFLVDNPDGVTWQQIATDQGFRNRERVYSIVQGLRDHLAADETVGVTCDPNPDDPTGPYLYTLSETYADARRWQDTWLGDTARRIATGLSQPTALNRATDGRTIEGRRMTALIAQLTAVHATFEMLIAEEV